MDRVPTLRHICMTTDMAKEGHPSFSHAHLTHLRRLQPLARQLPCSALAAGGQDEHFRRRLPWEVRRRRINTVLDRSTLGGQPQTTNRQVYKCSVTLIFSRC